MFKKTLAGMAAASVMLFTAPAFAQDVIAEYLTWLDPRDTVNSQGLKLKSFGAVLAQDRANYHRFEVCQPLDTSDPVFSDREMRAKLPQFYNAGRPVAAYIRENVMNGRGHYVFVRIMGKNGMITHVNVYEGAG